MKRLLYCCFLSIAFSLSSQNAEAASHYIRAGASGASNGSSWIDAWPSFPGSTAYVRGDEYYVADGAYAPATFSTPNSGTISIKICKATTSTVGSCSSAHGSDVGWSNTYGDGQATIVHASVGMTFTTGYWILDGIRGAGSIDSTGATASTYGFYFSQSFTSGISYQGVVTNGSNSTFKHIAVVCAGIQDNTSSQIAFNGLGSSLSFSYTHTNNCQIANRQQGADQLVEYGWFGRVWTSPQHHDVQLMSLVRPIYRNNHLTMCGSQCIEPAGACESNLVDGKIYNNIFANVTGSNGVAKGVCQSSINNTVFYGNTVVNSKGPLLYQSNNGTGSGNIVSNNLFYKTPSGCCVTTGGGAIARSYNSYFDSGIYTETSAENGSGDPFVNSSTGSYYLRSATYPGLALAAPYNMDLIGVQRGADGVWSRGALEFQGNVTLPPAPTNLSVQ